jgi:hypothetical protein
MISKRRKLGEYENSRSLESGKKYFIDLSAEKGNVANAIQTFGMGFGGSSFTGSPAESNFMIDQSMVQGKMAGMTGSPGVSDGSLVRVLFDNDGVHCAFLKNRSSTSPSVGGSDTIIFFNKNGNSCDMKDGL